MADERATPDAEADEDWEALARVAAGDRDAFGPLVERYQDRLVALCQRFLGDREAALDAAQEVFLKVYRHAGRARPKGRFFTWVYRIGVNHCLNRLRRRKIARFFSLSTSSPDEDGPPALDPASEAPDPEAEAEVRERWRRTRRALDRLPESQRAVVLLARFEGLSQKEVAATLGITEGAVESRLVRATRRLRAAQEGDWPGVPAGRVNA